jgi:ankyrin repeat protein
MRAQHPRLKRLSLEEIATAPPSLADAQWVVAREYTYANWAELKHRIEKNDAAVAIQDAIRKGDADLVVALLRQNPEFLHLPLRSKSRGAALKYAADAGQLGVLQAIAALGTSELQAALERAVLKGHLDCAGWLLANGAQLRPGIVMGPCHTLNTAALSFLADAGAPFTDEHGNELAPLAMVLTIYSRNPAGKHACILVFERLGYQLPDTAVMAFHRGRVDLLERHLRRDHGLLARRFPAAEIYPPDLGCVGPDFSGMCGTPIDGGTLLHLAIDFDEQEIFDWLLANGADVNAPATVDAAGFGGHTPLFNAVVGSRHGTEMGRALLARGADPAHRASLRKFLDWIERPRWHEALAVTPLEWGQSFPERDWVNSDLLAQLSAPN